MSESKFRKIYSDVLYYGQEVRPREQLVKEIENYSYTLGPHERFANFFSRKLNVKYIKKEFMWYLRGDRFDTSICEYAKIWKDVVNKDGSINSNYGQYIFRGVDNQFDNVVRLLSADKDSRRASISILSKDHLLSDTNDVPCTYSLNFRIRNGKLNMTVSMRSQDLVYGMGNDAPCFSFIHEMMLNSLKEIYPEIQYGTYYHHADSFHVYERHFDLLQKIVLDGDAYMHIECPKISGPKEVLFLRQYAVLGETDRAKLFELGLFPEEYKFTKWLISSE